MIQVYYENWKTQEVELEFSKFREFSMNEEMEKKQTMDLVEIIIKY